LDASEPAWKPGRRLAGGEPFHLPQRFVRYSYEAGSSDTNFAWIRR